MKPISHTSHKYISRSGEGKGAELREIVNKLIEVFEKGNIDGAIEALNKAEQISKSRDKKVFRKTTSSAYRRLHDILIHTIDNAIKLLRQGDTSACPMVQKELAKCVILAKYQVSREVLDEEIYTFVKKIYETIKDTNKCNVKVLENVRLAMDALVTIVKAYGKR